MIRQFCAAVVVGSAAWAESPPYVPYSGIIHGTEGAVAVVLTIQNDTDADLVCRAALAHWYSVDLGVAVVGEVVHLTLWHDPATGRLDLLNETRHRMPVEAIWFVLGRAQFDAQTLIDEHRPVGGRPDGNGG